MFAHSHPLSSQRRYDSPGELPSSALSWPAPLLRPGLQTDSEPQCKVPHRNQQRLPLVDTASTTSRHRIASKSVQRAARWLMTLAFLNTGYPLLALAWRTTGVLACRYSASAPATAGSPLLPSPAELQSLTLPESGACILQQTCRPDAGHHARNEAHPCTAGSRACARLHEVVRQVAAGQVQARDRVRQRVALIDGHCARARTSRQRPPRAAAGQPGQAEARRDAQP